MPSRPADVDFSEISLVRWIGSADSGQELVVRTELRQKERLKTTSISGFVWVVYTKLTSAALGSGLLQDIPNLEACFIH